MLVRIDGRAKQHATSTTWTQDLLVAELWSMPKAGIPGLLQF